MNRGHLRAFWLMIAFSIEKVSEGSPAMFHSRINTGLPRVLGRENLPAEGMLFSPHC